ncbi:KAP family P-loop NTPase fold protein [Deinococcus roseus]|uniref:KAP NTPase domain-containing protein n=1 Tax=Deinococcus roseus TaxID=392414 RepID=A0ABQ2D782_9DEIO|nr:P-loop NTPase fold protein [Deinococcus roseus]GGJ44068.1 hypothetical protein GCM10008938_32930 [Deinococcus roseus]
MTRPFNHDHPIGSLEEDLLQRGEFAQALAATLKHNHGHPGLSVAVCAALGEGKTSVKNLMLQHLRPEIDQGKIIYLEFNPWHWSGNEDLQTVFFREIDRKITQSGIMGDRKLLRSLSVYAAKLNYSGFFEDLVRLNVVLAALSGALTAAAVATRGTWMVWLFAGLLLVLLWFLVFRFRSTAINNQILTLKASTDKTLEEVKQELSAAMQKLQGQLVVCFDDLDRLDKAELKKVLQIIKANGDFPNVTYLSFFDREMVESLLQEAGQSGRIYLEKMFQVTLTLPEPDSEHLKRYFLQEAQKLLGEDPKQLRGVREVYDAVLQQQLTNVRRTKRFLNNVGFYALRFKTSSGFEISVMDLMLLEALRVHEPRAYNAFLERSYPFTNIVYAQLLTSQRQAAFTAMLEEATDKTWMGKVLWLLFPLDRKGIEKLPLFDSEIFLRPSAAGLSLQVLFQQFRLSHPHFFHRYFMFGIRKEDVRKSELDQMRALFAAGQSIRDDVLNLLDGERLTDALQGLQHHLSWQDEAFVLALTEALVSMEAELRVRDADKGIFDGLVLVWVRLFQKGSEDQNSPALLKALHAGKQSVFFQTLFLNRMVVRTRELGDRGVALLDSVLKMACTELATRIQVESKEPGFLQSEHAARFLLHWREHGDRVAFEAFWQARTSDFAALRELMKLFLSPIREPSDQGIRHGFRLHEDLMAVIDPEVLLARWRVLRPEVLSTEEEVMEKVFEGKVWVGGNDQALED